MAKDSIINLKEEAPKGGDDFGSIDIRERDSGLAEFTRRNMPTDREVDEFDRIVSGDGGAAPEGLAVEHEDVSEEEIDESLSEIYREDDGKMADVKKFKAVKRHGVIFWLLAFVLFSAVVSASGYYGYGYIQKKRINETAVDFSIEGKNEVIAGEEFSYTVYYHNKSGVILNNPRIEITYPDNFVFIESVPAPVDKNNAWQIDQLVPEESGKIKIKGYFVGVEDSTNVATANIIYMPDNFYSDFRKGATVNTRIKSIGMDIDFDYPTTALLNNDVDVDIRIRGLDGNSLKDFKVVVEPAENFAFVEKKQYSKEIEDARASTTQPRPGVWQFSEVPADERILPFTLKFTKKIADEQEVRVSFEKSSDENGRSYRFYEKVLSFSVIKSDLNLMTLINGTKDDKGVNFGETLSYSISFSNKGANDMKDLVIMAILDGELFDWSKLKMETKGKVVANTITWTKEEAPELALLSAGKEGAFDFSIPLLNPTSIDKEPSFYKVKSFAQYSFGDKAVDISKNGGDNVSNVIVNKINSDLKASDEVRYFNSDNIPVGTGPHPPKVGEKTSYKVYWKVTNSLRELRNTVMITKLPEGVEWADKSAVTAGAIAYNPETREVRWDIGRMPITVMETRADFEIAITPIESDRDKIKVLLSGSTVTAMDDEVGSEIRASTKAKTTKLEDDEIAAGGSGMVE